jgi:hypothetical protein
MSVKGGSKDAEESSRMGEFSASDRAAANIIAFVARRAPDATTPSPIAEKM